METTTMLPVHIVSSLLLTKYRFSGARIEQLITDTDHFLENLKAMQKYLLIFISTFDNYWIPRLLFKIQLIFDIIDNYKKNVIAD